MAPKFYYEAVLIALMALGSATWLGNDETHYVRKWENKELSDLKKLVELTVYWVASDILTRELEASMPDPKKAITG